MGVIIVLIFIINISIQRVGLCFDIMQQQFCVDIIENDIKEVLFLIDDNKFFGIDGFFLCFYKKVWSVIKDDLIKVMIDFFKKGKLLRIINCIVIYFYLFLRVISL